MKITEITEGYHNTDEGFADAWSTVKKGTSAVGGAMKRQADDMANTAMAKMGSGKAQGKQEIQRVVGGIIKNFNRYLGQTKGKPTVGTLKQYLTALGIQNPDLNEVAKGAIAGKARGGFNPSKRGAQLPKAQAPAQTQQQAPQASGRKDSDVLSRNDLFDIIGKNIQQAMTTGTLPKALQKFLGQ